MVARIVMVFALVGGPGCRTREEAARRAGREGAVAVGLACLGDGGDEGDREPCRVLACRERCASFADSVQLSEACTTKCLGQGTCDSDADCTGGLVCVMIAPRLRRCELRLDGAL
jgi:hypothetical protein